MDSTHTDSVLGEARGADDEQIVLTIVHHPEPDLIGVRRQLAPDAPALLGRASRSFFPGAFDVRSISREHAEVVLQDGHAVVRDLGSHNGTYVNGERLPRATVEPGDIIGLGDILLLLTVGPATFPEPDHPLLRGRSWPLARLIEQIETMAPDDQNVVLIGETGSGKELVARALHDASGRQGRFLAVNCGGMAEGVLQSELFGHEKGAFSGAGVARVGMVEAAAGGTLLLDEIASAPEGLQTTLLRLLETGEYRRVGSSEPAQSTARFVAALQPSEDETHGLRPDLWYRLIRRRIDVPALRHRREDILILAHRFAEACRGRPVRFSRRLALALLEHDWPGNVRELVAVVEQVAIGERGSDLLGGITWLERRSGIVETASREREPKARKRKPKAPRPSADELCAELAQRAGNVTEVAARYGVDRKTIYRWAKALDIDLDRVR